MFGGRSLRKTGFMVGFEGVAEGRPPRADPPFFECAGRRCPGARRNRDGEGPAFDGSPPRRWTEGMVRWAAEKSPCVRELAWSLPGGRVTERLRSMSEPQGASFAPRRGSPRDAETEGASCSDRHTPDS